MPNDVRVVFSHKGDERCGLSSQGIHEIRFSARLERRKVHPTDVLCIALPFFSHDHDSPLFRSVVCCAVKLQASPRGSLRQMNRE